MLSSSGRVNRTKESVCAPLTYLPGRLHQVLTNPLLTTSGKLNQEKDSLRVVKLRVRLETNCRSFKLGKLIFFPFQIFLLSSYPERLSTGVTPISERNLKSPRGHNYLKSSVTLKSSVLVFRDRKK